MKGPRPIGMSRRATMMLLFAVFAATVGYGVALPVLPHVVESLTPASPDSVGWHTGLLTAVYAGAPLLFAPLWGWWSDRHGRRNVLLLGLGGFGVTLALSALAPSLPWLYGGRFLNGAFAAAILPAAQALVADSAVSEAWRARRLAWIGMASITGFFIGPMLGAVVLQLGGDSADSMPPAQLLALPFLLSAGLAWLGVGGILRLEAGSAAAAVLPDREPGTPRRPGIPPLLLLAGVVAAGIAAFEVGLALRGRALGMEPYRIGIMFAECSLIMFAVQAIVFSPLVAPAMTAKLIAPALAIMGASLFLVPFAEDFVMQALAVGGVAASAGILTPILTYWISRGAGVAQGVELGRQAAVTSFGQMLGSAGAGILFGLEKIPDLGFLLPGVAAVIAAAASLRLARLLLNENLAAIAADGAAS
jgi:MFS family permease